MREQLESINERLLQLKTTPFIPQQARVVMVELYILLEQIVDEVEELKHGKNQG